MLKQLRNKKTAKKIWIVLAVIVIPAFVVWGSGSLMRSKSESGPAGTIMGRKIPFAELQESMHAVRDQAIMQFGDNFDEIEKMLDLRGQAWNRLILLSEAKRRKIKVSDQEVVNTIQNYPFFQGKGGFNDKTYEQIINYVFHTKPRVFEEETRQGLVIAKLFDSLTSGIKVSDQEIQDEYKKANDSVSIYYIAALPPEFAKDVTASDEEVRNFFTSDSWQFKLPLSFNIEYVEFTNETQNKDDSALRSKIEKIYFRLIRNEPFDKVAKENNITLKETGFFPETGPVPGIGWSAEVLGLIAGAKAGQYLGPIKADNTYYILHIKERKEPYTPEFDSVKDKVKEALIKDKARALAKEKIDSCLKYLREQTAKDPKSVDFDASAKEFGLKSSSTDQFKYGGYIEGIGASDAFWTIADALKDAEYSNVIDTQTGYYIIRIKSRTGVDENKFGQEKAAFTQKLLSQKKQEYFVTLMEELKKQSHPSESIPKS